jgi:hypothetical protein
VQRVAEYREVTLEPLSPGPRRLRDGRAVTVGGLAA